MKNKTNIKLPLTDIEKANLRKNKIKIANILDFATDELEVLLNSTTERAKEIYALAEFQTVPSVGIKFAEDLVFLGYYSLNELKQKDGAQLTDEWWDFTEERKKFRAENGYPKNRPQKAWFETLGYERKGFEGKLSESG
jgi:Pathogenicity locus